jgi:hypothetical protein
MSYSFLKESKLYIVYGGSNYRIYTSSAISFSQTFASDSYSVKTLHDQSKMFEGSTITKANPANFEFDVPLTKEKDESIIIDLLSDVTDGQLKSFDVYLQSNQSTFKLENAIITGGAIDFGLENPLTIRLQGEGTKFSKVGNESYTIPGSAQSESATRTPLMVYPVVSVDSLDMNNITSVTVNIQNNIDWIPFETLQNSLAVTDASNVMRVSNYVVNKRIISGAISQYQTDNNINQFDDFSTNANITLKGVKTEDAADATPFIQLALNPATFTARMTPSEVFMQSYDFSYTGSATVDSIITQYENS